MNAVLILSAMTLERLGELWLASRNTSRLLARGAREFANGHYPLIVAVHVAWLGVLWWTAPARPVAAGWLAVLVALQAARLWIILALGPRWTTRIIILPGPLVQRGPYRFLKHPNYLVVVAEIAVLPMVFGLPTIALLFTAVNSAVLAFRISAENDALRHAGKFL